MANNLKEQAIQTFCIVPEIYQQALQEAGADFPDELVQQIKQDPQGAAEKLAQDEQLTNALVQIFEGNREAIMQAVQQATQGMFKQGGKLQQGLERFQTGGNLRRQAINSAMAANGFNRAQARTAYRNLRNAGMSKADILASFAPSVGLEDINVTTEDFGPIDTTISMKEATLPQVSQMQNPVSYDNMKFADAFAAARKSGAQTFNWKGGNYGTNLKGETLNLPAAGNSISPSTTYQPTTSFTGKNPLDAQLNDTNLRSQERERIRQERINNSISPSTEALQKGGSFTRVIKAVGDTLDTKKYNYSTQTRQTKPDGSIIYSVETRNYSDKYYDPTKTIPSGFRQFINGGMKPVPSELKENWDEILKNHVGEITIDKTKSRLQKGGSLAKKEKINNKYFSKLEKSGRKSSKEMEDLSQARKAELKKVK